MKLKIKIRYGLTKEDNQMAQVYSKIPFGYANSFFAQKEIILLETTPEIAKEIKKLWDKKINLN